MAIETIALTREPVILASQHEKAPPQSEQAFSPDAQPLDAKVEAFKLHTSSARAKTAQFGAGIGDTGSELQGKAIFGAIAGMFRALLQGLPFLIVSAIIAYAIAATLKYGFGLPVPGLP